MTSTEALQGKDNKNTIDRRKRAKEKERLLKKQLKEEELKHKKEERAHKAAMKESKLLEKQYNKQTRARKSKCTGSMPDVTVDKLTLDEAIDGLPVDAAADNTAEESTCNNKDSLKQKSTGTAPFNVKRSKHTADDEIDVNR